MPDEIKPKADRLGADAKQGPNPMPGGKIEADADSPPYEGRTGGSDNATDRAESVKRQMEGAQSGTADQTASPADEAPVSSSDAEGIEPESPKGVGDSPSRGGEEVAADEDEPGRHDLGEDPETGRPVGTSDKRDITGVG